MPTNHQDLTHWTLTKNGQRATAVFRYIENIGVELRLLWNDDVRESRLYRGHDAVAEARAEADARRRDLESRGWSA
jgi:hypothetical protein